MTLRAQKDGGQGEVLGIEPGLHCWGIGNHFMEESIQRMSEWRMVHPQVKREKMQAYPV